MYESSKTLTWIEREVLDLAVEDYTRLADVYAQVSGGLPGHDADEYVRLSQAIVKKLLRLSCVKLFIDDLTEPTKRVVTELPPEAVRAAFTDLRNWLPEQRPCPDHVCIAIGATKRGEQAMGEE